MASPFLVRAQALSLLAPGIACGRFCARVHGMSVGFSNHRCIHARGLRGVARRRSSRPLQELLQAALSRLPQRYHGLTTVLPQRYHSGYHSVTNSFWAPRSYHSVNTVLPQCYHSGLLRCYHSVPTVLPQCYHSVTTVLPQCYHSGLLRCYHSVHGQTWKAIFLSLVAAISLGA